MIRALAALLGGKTWLAWLMVAVLGLGAVGGLYAYVDHQGYKRAEIKWSQKYDARELELQTVRFRELDRQATVNADAKAREAAILAAEQARADALEALIADLASAADEDPNKDRIGLGADSIKRLDRIR